MMRNWRRLIKEFDAWTADHPEKEYGVKQIVKEYEAWMDAHPEKEYGMDSLGEFFPKENPNPQGVCDGHKEESERNKKRQIAQNLAAAVKGIRSLDGSSSKRRKRNLEQSDEGIRCLDGSSSRKRILPGLAV
jgi:hypothetical protein